jgi:cysteinyl-tRNA synthetase
MDIYLHNTLSGKTDKFVPLEKTVRMYHCGPTVYNYAHIGNLRSYVFAGLLRNLLEYTGYETKQVINITDFGHLVADKEDGEDKMTLALKREGKPMTLEAMKEIGEFYTKAFVKDLQDLHIILPHHLPKASDHIEEDKAIVQNLLDSGVVYPTSDGLYFNTATYPDYGKLGNIKVECLKEGVRVESNPEKKNPADFAVWKFNKEFGWDAPWGKGFPGWHIECSAMAIKYLGETFDIHTGGIDHIPVHHNNEIAQSESYTRKEFAKYWLHNDFITIDNQKISKSLSNDIYLKDVAGKNINPLAYKYWLYTSHYQSIANFTWEALAGAQEAYNKIVRLVASYPNITADKSEISDIIITPIYTNFNTPEAIASMWDMLKDDTYTPESKVGALLEIDKILYLNLREEARKSTDIPENIRILSQQREEARKNKDWKSSDALRNAIQDAGYTVEDGQNGQKISTL